MPDGLDVVAIGIEHERAVVTGVVAALSRRAVVPPARLDGSSVEPLDSLGIARLEGEMDLRDLACDLTGITFFLWLAERWPGADQQLRAAHGDGHV